MTRDIDVARPSGAPLWAILELCFFMIAMLGALLVLAALGVTGLRVLLARMMRFAALSIFYGYSAGWRIPHRDAAKGSRQVKLVSGRFEVDGWHQA